MRFIPARAGNTALLTARKHGAAVHPRAGGEHLEAKLGRAKITGSSPRGRGTRVMPVCHCRSRRFIPARAGNTDERSQSALQITVHPRAGGEHAPSPGKAQHTSGSSPRGRGTLGPQQRREIMERFIPARAGNTGLGLSPRPYKPVHPRAGGEHDLTGANLTEANDSSPRGRGTLHHTYFQAVSLRFIPARAGNTCPKITPQKAIAVHPRAGGEHSLSQVSRYSAPGSSPRGRGTRQNTRVEVMIDRFIPARAGNTELG